MWTVFSVNIDCISPRRTKYCQTRFNDTYQRCKCYHFVRVNPTTQNLKKHVVNISLRTVQGINWTLMCLKWNCSVHKTSHTLTKKTEQKVPVIIQTKLCKGVHCYFMEDPQKQLRKHAVSCDRRLTSQQILAQSAIMIQLGQKIVVFCPFTIFFFNF